MNVRTYTNLQEFRMHRLQHNCVGWKKTESKEIFTQKVVYHAFITIDVRSLPSYNRQEVFRENLRIFH